MTEKEIFDNVEKKIASLKKADKLDLSSDQDLSLAVMNLVSIEEHFFFTAKKTGKDGYFNLLEQTREIRKTLLKKLIKQSEGEVWCISKHLLAASMRLMEVGTKLFSADNKMEAKEMFEKSYQLYSLFWAINLGVIDTSGIQSIDDQAISRNDKEKNGFFGKFGSLVRRAIDCCLE